MWCCESKAISPLTNPFKSLKYHYFCYTPISFGVSHWPDCGFRLKSTPLQSVHSLLVFARNPFRRSDLLPQNKDMLSRWTGECKLALRHDCVGAHGIHLVLPGTGLTLSSVAGSGSERFFPLTIAIINYFPFRLNMPSNMPFIYFLRKAAIDIAGNTISQAVKVRVAYVSVEIPPPARRIRCRRNTCPASPLNPALVTVTQLLTAHNVPPPFSAVPTCPKSSEVM